MCAEEERRERKKKKGKHQKAGPPRLAFYACPLGGGGGKGGGTSEKKPTVKTRQVTLLKGAAAKGRINPGRKKYSKMSTIIDFFWCFFFQKRCL